MNQTVAATKRRGGVKTTGNLSRLERDIKAYELHMMGLSIRGVQEELAIKAIQTANDAIKRGKKYCIERGINVEERKIEIDVMFKETLGALAQTIREQSQNGCLEYFTDPQGNVSTKRKAGIDPRIAGELSRSLHRWSEFLGIMDRAQEVNSNSTTLIQLAVPSDGASFSDKWSGKGETVEAADISAPALESANG